jgi:hypothetical protein
VALAVQEKIPDARHIAVDLQTIRFTRKGLRYCFLTPHAAQDIIVATDQGRRDQLKPAVLRLRPAIISKVGKKRNHTPTDSELRGSGLTINKTQLHLDEPDMKPQRLTQDGQRNLDVDRLDGPAAPAPDLHNSQGIAPPQRKRQARAMVSTAHKGTIPTTLGGRLPPVSILARREFGLRQLRR